MTHYKEHSQVKMYVLYTVYYLCHTEASMPRLLLLLLVVVVIFVCFFSFVFLLNLVLFCGGDCKGNGSIWRHGKMDGVWT